MEDKKEIIKIPTTGNTADALTKHLDWAGIDRHVRGISQRFESGRHPDMPDVAETEELTPSESDW